MEEAGWSARKFQEGAFLVTGDLQEDGAADANANLGPDRIRGPKDRVVVDRLERGSGSGRELRSPNETLVTTDLAHDNTDQERLYGDGNGGCDLIGGMHMC